MLGKLVLSNRRIGEKVKGIKVTRARLFAIVGRASVRNSGLLTRNDYININTVRIYIVLLLKADSLSLYQGASLYPGIDVRDFASQGCGLETYH